MSNSIKLSPRNVPDPLSVPSLSSVTWDGCKLEARVDISLDTASEMKPVYIIFFWVEGFRMLDEFNLNEFWDKKKKISSWLCEVESGGWLDHEKSRSGFLSREDNLKEYLIIGQEECLSVFSNTDPVIIEPDL
ncbi:hypothetical protein [Grimontia sp. NTOU-MAR1]|uniref:hypothetical protein n=1 Tax=Grimontia sp. NTOU-MAR1 TaxID=3111011 RepID=UPI002DB55D64|nr:hypothetical protein [Grimontia sp. NTOU-MAR1]WRV97970.1 hypothetical protein VP504_00585 [Grimontia sp. NTOU-MAR1]